MTAGRSEIGHSNNPSQKLTHNPSGKMLAGAQARVEFLDRFFCSLDHSKYEDLAQIAAIVRMWLSIIADYRAGSRQA